MRWHSVFLLVFGSATVAAAQRHVPLSNAILAAEFDRSGDHLFALLPDRIQQIRTGDAVVVREFTIPNTDDAAQRRMNPRPFGLTSDERTLILVQPDHRVLILNLDAEPNAAGINAAGLNEHNARWQTVEVPNDPDDPSALHSTHSMRFGGNLADGKLLFANPSTSVPGGTTLLLYDRESRRFAGPPVELEDHCFVSPVPDQDAVSAIRSAPVNPPPHGIRIWQPVPCKVERLRIRWDDHGYGQVSAEAVGYVPEAPESISPDFETYVSSLGKPQTLTTGWLITRLGNLQWGNNISSAGDATPKSIHEAFVSDRGGGGIHRRWSGNSERLVITRYDYTTSPKPNPTSVSLFTRSGRRIGMFPTGRARFVRVIAVSHDGTRFVTSAGIKIPETTLLWHVD